MSAERKFLLATARLGQEAAVADFLSGAVSLAEQESGALRWHALQLGASTFGVFDTFADDASRQAHLDGPIAAALMGNAEALLAEPPRIEHAGLLAVK